jgi:hypothetical protein
MARHSSNSFLMSLAQTESPIELANVSVGTARVMARNRVGGLSKGPPCGLTEG